MARILIVDDEMRGSRSLESALRLEAVDVVFAECAKHAMALMAAQPFDLVVLDLMRSDVTGLELARRIRTAFPSVRTVLTSTYHLSERQLERADCGAVGFVPKPFDFTALVSFLVHKTGRDSSPMLPVRH
jgi:DNA-binding NtrC family response regulator